MFLLLPSLILLNLWLIIKKNQKERQKAEARREKARLKNAVEKQENDKIIMDVNKPKYKFVDKGGSKRWKKLLDK